MKKLQKQTDWIKETFYDYDIENLILVGGESSKIEYSGPSVNSTSEYITRDLNTGRFDSFVEELQSLVEILNLKGLLRKGSNGIEFFTTQVLYDSEKIKKMLNIIIIFVKKIKLCLDVSC